jgi:hypothetical protein
VFQVSERYCREEGQTIESVMLKENGNGVNYDDFVLDLFSGTERSHPNLKQYR